MNKYQAKIIDKINADNFLLLNRFNNSKDYLELYCLNHDLHFKVSASKYVNKNQHCYICKGTKTHNKQINFNKIKNYCLNNNFLLISDKYLNCHSKLTLQCKDCKYVIHRTSSSLLANDLISCPVCDNRLTNKIDKYNLINKHCKKIGYTLVSKEYKRAKETLKFICNKGHRFQMTPDGFMNASNRCKICSYETNVSGLYKLNHYKTLKDKLINEQCYIYLAYFYSEEESFYKIGLTSNIKSRFKSVYRKYKMKYLLIQKGNTYILGLLELFILNYFKYFSYRPNKKFSGYTECLNIGIDLKLICNFIQCDPIKKEGELLKYLEAK